MKVYKGSCASPGLVLGQVSRLEHHVETTTVGPFKPSRELQLLTDAIRTAQDELESMADRAAPSEQAIFQFQSMMLDDEGMMNEVRFCINAGIGAAAAMNQVGQRYADQLANMKDNPYMQLRSVDILDASRRVINIITNRPRMWLALDHPVILAAERLMPTDLFSVPSGMILGIITAEGNGQSRHHCPGNEYPRHRAGGPGFSGRLRRPHRDFGRHRGPVHVGPGRCRPPAGRDPHLRAAAGEQRDGAAACSAQQDKGRPAL